MTDAWFADADPGDPEPGVTRVRADSASAPTDWPAEAVGAGFAADESGYYTRFRSATFAATNEAIMEREHADDVQPTHTMHAADDAERITDELAEQIVKWAGTLYEEIPHGLSDVRNTAIRGSKIAAEERVVSYATRAVGLLDGHDDLRVFIERRVPTTAPNLAGMAKPVLAAWLIALADGLKPLTKRLSGTAQVLRAEDALFAHLKGHTTSLKYGVILTHEYARGTRPEDRGSAARALAGKLAIVARAGRYSGDCRLDLHAELADRMETIRTRADEGGDE